MKKRPQLITALVITALALTGCSAQQLVNREPQQPTEITFYLMRHGRTMLNSTHRAQGWADAALTSIGEEVVGDAGIGLKDVDFQNVYSSDSGRAIQTAGIVIEKNDSLRGREPVRDRRFREFNFGSYEGEFDRVMEQDMANDLGISYERFKEIQKPETKANLAAKLDKRRVKPDAEPSWPAENYETILKRLREGLDDIVARELQRNGSGNILLVSHGLSIGSLLILISGNPDIYDTKSGLTNASISTIKYKDGVYTVGKTDDMSYVEAGKKAKAKS